METKEMKTVKREGLARVSAAAEWLSMSRGAVYKGIGNGTIPHVRIDGNVRIPWAWLNRQATLTEGVALADSMQHEG